MGSSEGYILLFWYDDLTAGYFKQNDVLWKKLFDSLSTNCRAVVNLPNLISMVPLWENFQFEVLKDNDDLIWRDVAYQENGENELAQERVKRDNKYISRRIKASGRRHLIPFNSTLVLLLHTSHSVSAGLRGICLNLWKVLSRTLWRDRIE